MLTTTIIGRSPTPLHSSSAVGEMVHLHSRGHADAKRCCGKTLIVSPSLRFSVSQHARGNQFPSVLVKPLGHLSASLESHTYSYSVRENKRIVIQPALALLQNAPGQPGVGCRLSTRFRVF